MKKIRVGEPNCYTDYKKMLAYEKLDVLCITNPTDKHPEHILAGLEAGLSVFCDKPLASSLKGHGQVVWQNSKTRQWVFITAVELQCTGICTPLFNQKIALKTH